VYLTSLHNVLQLTEDVTPLEFSLRPLSIAFAEVKWNECVACVKYEKDETSSNYWLRFSVEGPLIDGWGWF
jgi:hypothetical protein